MYRKPLCRKLLCKLKTNSNNTNTELNRNITRQQEGERKREGTKTILEEEETTQSTGGHFTMNGSDKDYRANCNW